VSPRPPRPRCLRRCCPRATAMATNHRRSRLPQRIPLPLSGPAPLVAASIGFGRHAVEPSPRILRRAVWHSRTNVIQIARELGTPIAELGSHGARSRAARRNREDTPGAMREQGRSCVVPNRDHSLDRRLASAYRKLSDGLEAPARFQPASGGRRENHLPVPHAVDPGGRLVRLHHAGVLRPLPGAAAVDAHARRALRNHSLRHLRCGARDGVHGRLAGAWIAAAGDVQAGWRAPRHRRHELERGTDDWIDRCPRHEDVNPFRV
jgi:hypothetical protein